MYEERFLEKALEEIESLRGENEELKRKLCIYEWFAEQVKKISDNWKEKDEKR